MRQYLHLRSLANIYLWLSHILQRLRPIFRFFLVLLMVVFGLGFASSLEGSFNGIAGGQTNVAYQIAIHRNNGSLNPLSPTPRYRLSTTPDAETQKYFELDEQEGDLLLRDGLQTISPLMNPLQVFPVRIDLLDDKQQPIPEKAIGLYVRIVGCPEFRWWKDQAITAVAIPEEWENGPAEQLLECQESVSSLGSNFVLKQRRMLEIQGWLKKVKIPGFLHVDEIHSVNKEEEMLRQLYMKQLNDVFGIEPPPSDSIHWVLVLQQDARPGQKIVDMQEILKMRGLQHVPSTRSAPKADQQGSGKQGRRSEGTVAADRWLIAALHLRLPFLLGIGFVLPLLVYVTWLQHRAIRAAMQPYLLLLVAQIITMLVALQMMGEGLVLWVGLIYTWLRVIQLLGLLNVGAPALWFKETPSSRTARRWLIPLLWMELVLWGVNGFGLLWHIGSVFRQWNFIAPA